MKNIAAQIKELTNLFFRGRYVLFSNMLEKVTFFLLFIIIARTYSKDVYGSVVALFALFNIIMSFFDFGFNIYFQRESALEKKDISPEIANGLSIRLISLIPYFLIAYIYFFITGGANQLLNYLLGAGVFLFGINNLLNSILFGRKLFEVSFRLLLLARIVLVAGILLTSCTGFAIEWTITIFLLSGVIHFFSLSIFLSKTAIAGLTLSLNPVILRKIFKSSIPLGIGVIMGWLYDRVDVLILKEYLGEASVAIYAAAYSLYKFPQAFANGIFTPLFSNLSKAFAINGYLTFTDIKKTLKFLLVYSAIVIAAVLILGDQIVLLLYGSKYTESCLYLTYLMIALPFLLLNNMTGMVLNVCYKEYYTTLSVVIAAIVNVVMNIILIRVLGITGAVFATFLTELSILTIEIFFIYRFKLLNK